MPDQSTGTVSVTANAKLRETQPEASKSSNPAPMSQGTKPEFTVADVAVGRMDSANKKILCVYAKVSPQYAVYLTQGRIVVQYADDPKVAEAQRKDMASLNALRMQIEGLIDGWRSSRLAAYRRKAKRYDGRLAAALIVCLESDGVTAHASLSDIKDDLVAERTSWGRFEYLIAASIASLFAITLFFCIQRQAFPFNLPAGDLWLAARAGTVGAFFSIALAIRTRTVLTNLRRQDNFADAILRIVIGIVAAGVLLLIIKAGMFPKLQIGDANISARNLGWEAILMVGFIAGFSERLVPDLLAKSATKESGATSNTASASSDAAPGSGTRPSANVPAPTVVTQPGK